MPLYLLWYRIFILSCISRWLYWSPTFTSNEWSTVNCIQQWKKKRARILGILRSQVLLNAIKFEYLKKSVLCYSWVSYFWKMCPGARFVFLVDNNKFLPFSSIYLFIFLSKNPQCLICVWSQNMNLPLFQNYVQNPQQMKVLFLWNQLCRCHFTLTRLQSHDFLLSACICAIIFPFERFGDILVKWQSALRDKSSSHDSASLWFNWRPQTRVDNGLLTTALICSLFEWLVEYWNWGCIHWWYSEIKCLLCPDWNTTLGIEAKVFRF